MTTLILAVLAAVALAVGSYALDNWKAQRELEIIWGRAERVAALYDVARANYAAKREALYRRAEVAGELDRCIDLLDRSQSHVAGRQRHAIDALNRFVAADPQRRADLKPMAVEIHDAVTAAHCTAVQTKLVKWTRVRLRQIRWVLPRPVRPRLPLAALTYAAALDVFHAVKSAGLEPNLRLLGLVPEPLGRFARHLCRLTDALEPEESRPWRVQVAEESPATESARGDRGHLRLLRRSA